jgi:dihydroorotase
MKILIQAAEIIAPHSPFHRKKKNVLINNGKIAEIGDKKYSADKVINAKGMFLSAGWFDLSAFAGDPGLEHKEDLQSIAQAAAAGGFTELALLPNTNPAIQTKNDVSYIKRNNDSRLVQMHAIAAVSKSVKGEELTEMMDLHHAGAIAFSDGLKPVWHTDIFLKTLQYLQPLDALLIDHPEDIWLNMFGQMNEGMASTQLGLKGMPRLAEEIMIKRNVELLRYAGGKLHLSKLSSAASFDLVRAAKKSGLQITCDVTSYQALLSDDLLKDFDTNYKVNPPLREKADHDAIIKALNDGTIDVLCSGHLPQDEESKNLEFDLADFGIINLQTFASQLSSLSNSVDVADLIEKVAYNPRKILKLEIPSIEKEAKANLTLFDPKHEWEFSDKNNLSKAKNSPWLGHKLKGKAVACFNNAKNYIDKEVIA